MVDLQRTLDNQERYEAFKADCNRTDRNEATTEDNLLISESRVREVPKCSLKYISTKIDYYSKLHSNEYYYLPESIQMQISLMPEGIDRQKFYSNLRKICASFEESELPLDMINNGASLDSVLKTIELKKIFEDPNRYGFNLKGFKISDRPN